MFYVYYRYLITIYNLRILGQGDALYRRASHITPYLRSSLFRNSAVCGAGDMVNSINNTVDRLCPSINSISDTVDYRPPQAF